MEPNDIGTLQVWVIGELTKQDAKYEACLAAMKNMQDTQTSAIQNLQDEMIKLLQYRIEELKEKGNAV